MMRADGAVCHHAKYHVYTLRLTTFVLIVPGTLSWCCVSPRASRTEANDDAFTRAAPATGIARDRANADSADRAVSPVLRTRDL